MQLETFCDFENLTKVFAHFQGRHVVQESCCVIENAKLKVNGKFAKPVDHEKIVSEQHINGLPSIYQYHRLGENKVQFVSS